MKSALVKPVIDVVDNTCALRRDLVFGHTTAKLSAVPGAQAEKRSFWWTAIRMHPAPCINYDRAPMTLTLGCSDGIARILVISGSPLGC